MITQQSEEQLIQTKFIHYMSIGAAADPEHRNIGWDIWQHGWQPFVDRWIKPMIDQGVKRFEIHNPAGGTPGNNMECSQFVQSREAGLKMVSQDFVKAWRPIAEKYEVLCYVGTPALDPSFLKLKIKKTLADNYLYRLWDSFRLPLEAGMTIGFDAMSAVPVTEPDSHFMELISSLGIRSYIEAWPPMNMPHLFKFPCIFTQSVWENMQWDHWWATEDVYQAEKCRILNLPPQGKTWTDIDTWGPEWVRDCWAHGHTSMFSFWEQMNRGITLKQWMNAVPLVA